MPLVADPIEHDLREKLAAYDDLTAHLLARRGITEPDAAEQFLNPSYDEHLHDPLTMIDMPRAAERIARAIEDGERIAVWSDYDCDGGPGGVIMHDFLKRAGASFENYIPHRHLEGYGVNPDGVEKLAARGARLLITVDSGITDVEAVARARELGMDVIVTDHHLPGAVMPEATALIDPNARADEAYPFRDLCGAALAWKLVCATLAIAPELRERDMKAGWEKWLLDMAGLATIADVVPLVGENRVIATYGLLVLRKSPRIGLARLLRATRVFQREVSEDDVAFMIAPRVNAASRMGDAYDVLRLFTTTDEPEADEIVKRLEQANRERKASAGAITRAVHARLAGREMRDVIALGDPDWKPSLLGLVASGIAEEYDRPVFLWGREGNMNIKGSVRSGGAVHALELMSAAENTFIEFGGHAASGGFTLAPEAVFDLEDRLVAAFHRLPEREDAPVAVLADADIGIDQVTHDLLARVNRLAPFGRSNEKPRFRVRNARIKSVTKFGKGNEHMKVTLAGERGTIDAVAFFAKGPLASRAAAIGPGDRVHLVGHIERDMFSRGRPVRMRLLDLAPV